MKLLVCIIALMCLFSDNVNTNNDSPTVEISEVEAVADWSNLNLEEMLKTEDINDLKLTIYCTDPHLLTRYPYKMEHLIQFHEFKTEVYGEDLYDNIELFYKISNSSLTPYSAGYYLHARMGYTLESKKNGVLLEVGFYCSNETVLVNGVEVRDSQCLYDIIKAYASDEILELYKGMLTEGWQSNL